MTLIPTLHHPKRHCARCGRLKHVEAFEAADEIVCTTCRTSEHDHERRAAESRESRVSVGT